ncbi:TniB family NTP-binding protein [Cupriavidus sp. P-10]|uniref:TniB family NTP-binding protein n=1 Tax=Cupriavidus sp. P-10 TaxID=2027911 RepID=UPI000EBF8C54|nr:TniB family NTP-binding protein [Cupriavidus sp. P-10]BDB27793.1 TniB family NTP-binding protein [Cupriavidus sp. P-10]
MTNPEMESLEAEEAFAEKMALVYELPLREKIRHLRGLRIKHRNLEDVANRMLELLCPCNDVSIISLAGVSGVGKSTLVFELVADLLVSADYGFPGGILPLSIPALKGQKTEASVVYDLALDAINEKMKDQKVAYEVIDGRIVMLPKREAKKVSAKQKEMMTALKNRQILALALDEFFHLLRFGDQHATLDSIKSCADDCGPKIIIIGGFEMLEAVDGYAQIQLRGSDLYLARYGAKSGCPDDEKEEEGWHKEEKEAYSEILVGIQNQWPYRERPNLAAHVDHFYTECLGNMRATKKLCAALAQKQDANHGQWDDEYFSDCRLQSAKLARMKAEFEEQEERIRGFDDGWMARDIVVDPPKKFPTSSQRGKEPATSRSQSR